MASAEDMRDLLERIGGMERALMERQVRADQATAVSNDCTACPASGRGSSSRGHRCVSCDGRETNWTSFKFQFVTYCEAIDRRLKDLLVLGETRELQHCATSTWTRTREL